MDELIEQFQRMIESMATSIFNEQGHLMPMAVVLAEKKEGEGITYEHHIVNIDPSFMQNSHSKDHLADKVIPGIMAEMKAKQSKPLCSVFISEVWYKTHNVTPEEAKRYKESGNLGHSFASLKVEKKEAIMLCFETSGKGWIVNYIINRLPQDKFNLTRSQEANTETGGRFSSLFQKAKEYEQRKSN